MTTATMANFTVDNIAKWLGGYGRVKAMVGVTRFVYDGNSLTFDFKMCKQANKVKITYNEGSDLYDVTFYKVRKLDWKEVDQSEGVYGEDLRSLFERFTGLYLRF